MFSSLRGASFLFGFERAGFLGLRIAGQRRSRVGVPTLRRWGMGTDAVHTSADSLITAGRLDQQDDWAAHGAAPRQSYGARDARPELQGALSFLAPLMSEDPG